MAVRLPRIPGPFRLALRQSRVWAVLASVCLAAAPVQAQQREPAFEVYALGGPYLHGNAPLARAWKPQIGGGLLAPVGRNWAALVDVTTSALTLHWVPAGIPGPIAETNYARERRIILTPSFVRLWRRDRFSVYAGAGIGAEHRRQHNRTQLILPGPDGQPAFSGVFDERRTSRTSGMFALRGGTIISVSRTVVVRAGFSFLPRYSDDEASKSVEMGVGFRF